MRGKVLYSRENVIKMTDKHSNLHLNGLDALEIYEGQSD